MLSDVARLQCPFVGTRKIYEHHHRMCPVHINIIYIGMLVYKHVKTLWHGETCWNTPVIPPATRTAVRTENKFNYETHSKGRHFLCVFEHAIHIYYIMHCARGRSDTNKRETFQIYEARPQNWIIIQCVSPSLWVYFFFILFSIFTSPLLPCASVAKRKRDGKKWNEKIIR